MHGSKLSILKKRAEKTYWGQRILGELNYAARISKVQQGKYEELINSVINYLNEGAKEIINKENTLKSEEMLKEIKREAKKYTIICAAHAHIDMNWQWRWDETVSITIDTFKTVLDLMEEYSGFKFSQSQASVYKIMEKYDPETLAKIKKRIHEGRWEVTASTWVEADKNLISAESMAKHILYTKRYLSDLLDINPDSLSINFEPDTFGHSCNVPEVLSKGGIKYYYHCRGYDGYNLYRWQSKSGKSVIVNREGAWYNDQITPNMVNRVPEFCSKHGINYLLKVYGIGDHGGGPTRRDLERIEDMNKWPIFPKIKYGTFMDFFKELDKIADKLPVVNNELNYVFTGCYSSQARIKKANRIAENMLVDAEIYNSFSDLCNVYSYNNKDFFQAWEKTLFNQFHDILPGSGTIDTREHALGLYQEIFATASSKRKLALNKIAENINTIDLIEKEDPKETISEGAGVGFGVADFKIAQSSRGKGNKRIFHVFNSAPVKREEVLEFVIWDWQEDKNKIVFLNEKKEIIEHQIISQGINHYWGHSYIKVLLKVEAPPCGYTTYIMKEDTDYELPSLKTCPSPRLEEIEEFILENEKIKVEFDSQTGSLISFVDKDSGKEYLTQGGKGGFRLIYEDDSKGMTSWIVGRYMKIMPLNNEVKVKKILNGSLKKAIQMETCFRDSSLKAIISLDKGSSYLNYEVECDWQEKGIVGEKIPQLNYQLQLNYQCSSYIYDIPFGTIERAAMDRDVPASSFALAVDKNENKKGIMLITDSKNGFRGNNNSIAVTLIRSSYDPDPYPELGIHKINFALNLVDIDKKQKLLQYSYNYNNPLHIVSNSRHKGDLSAKKSFFTLKEGNIIITDIKIGEESFNGSQNCIIRLFETEGKSSNCIFEFFKKPQKAYFVDINEKIIKEENLIKLKGNLVLFKVQAYSIVSLCVEFD